MSIKRDYKPASSWKTRRRLRLHGLIVIVLVMGGLVGALLVYFSQDTPDPIASSGTTAKRDAYVPPDKPPAAPKPKYDFYNVLPERALIVPEEDEENAAAPAPRPTPAEPNADNAAGGEGGAATATVEALPSGNQTSYFVQAGSFRNYADADRRKASLAMMGIPAQIYAYNRDDGAILHRVRIGPIDDRNAVETLQQRLSANDIASIAIRSK